ncbi:hypothetical protein [Methylobacterium iners]|uniref:hypothetical protein n=1 Tax=Methylobacterium iners TaxID=418707 RepID=UPI001EE38AE6|nr:hypothetical protein [Methylobacterium iners]
MDRIDHVKRQRKLAKLIVYHNKIVKHHGDRSPLAAEVVGEARAAWAAAIQPDAPFSAMALAYLEAHPLP